MSEHSSLIHSRSYLNKCTTLLDTTWHDLAQRKNETFVLPGARAVGCQPTRPKLQGATRAPRSPRVGRPPAGENGPAGGGVRARLLRAWLRWLARLIQGQKLSPHYQLQPCY